MSLATYSDLQTAVQNFLRRSDLATVIPDLITLAEVRINGDLDARKQDVLLPIYTAAGVRNVSLPDDLINMRSAKLTNDPDVVLDYMAPDQFSTVYPSITLTGVPQAFMVIGSSMYLAPVPDDAYEIRLLYKSKIPSLEANGTTWLMTTYPHVYLYATLCEAAPYIKDDNRIAIWERKYQEAIDSVNAQDWYSGSTMRVRTDVRP